MDGWQEHRVPDRYVEGVFPLAQPAAPLVWWSACCCKVWLEIDLGSRTVRSRQAMWKKGDYPWQVVKVEWRRWVAAVGVMSGSTAFGIWLPGPFHVRHGDWRIDIDEGA